MLPPIRRGQSSSAVGQLTSRVSSLLSSSSPVLLCVLLIALLFLFVTAASSLPSFLLSGGQQWMSSRVKGGSGVVGVDGGTDQRQSMAASRGHARPLIVQWEAASGGRGAGEGQQGRRDQPVAVPAGGAPLVPPSPPLIEGDGVWSPRAQAIKAAFVHSYSHYEKACFGQDEYRPLSGRCHNWIGAGLTIIDALPTMAVMGLTGEFDRAVKWVTNELRLDQNLMTSFFETTIRVLGGLVSTYDLGGGKDQALLQKAKLLGDRLLPVFNTPTGIPYAQINLATGAAAALSWTGGASLLAELGTCQMEFFSLSHRLQDDRYAKVSQKPIDVIDKSRPSIPGLYPIYISPSHGSFTNNKVAWGAMGDSFYEYLLKMYLLTGKQHEQYRSMYIQSVTSMLTHLYSHTPKGTAYIADLDNGQKDHKMDHLVCFVPGMLALGVKHGVVEGDMATQHMKVAHELMDTCYNMYHLQQPTGIGAEYSRFTPEMTPGHDASYKLRPETVESLFVLWRVTGEVKFREWGWEIWQNIDRHCRVDGGYAALMDVRQPHNKEDKMESFFLAETLKYLYLLFSPNSLIPIFPTPDNPDFYVFNTECHPIKAWRSWPI